MLNIQVHTSGAVTGDVGRIMAYENQTYSESIKFLHPVYGGALYKVVYIWGHTQMSDMLDSNDEVRLRIDGPGILKCQFIAEDAATGKVHLASKPFNLIIHTGINGSSDGATNCYRKFTCGTSAGYNCNVNEGNMAEVIIKQGIELAQEEQVRADNDSAIWDEILIIKNMVAQLAGNTCDCPIVADCNEIITEGSYKIDIGSSGLPDSGNISTIPFILDVKTLDPQVIQIAYSAGEGTVRMFIRTGTVVDGVATWVEWTPVI